MFSQLIEDKFHDRYIEIVHVYICISIYCPYTQIDVCANVYGICLLNYRHPSLLMGLRFKRDFGASIVSLVTNEAIAYTAPSELILQFTLPINQGLAREERAREKIGPREQVFELLLPGVWKISRLRIREIERERESKE